MGIALVARVAAAQSAYPGLDSVRLLPGDDGPWLALAATRATGGEVEIQVSGREFHDSEPRLLVSAGANGQRIGDWDVERGRGGYGVVFVVAEGAGSHLCVAMPDAPNVHLGAFQPRATYAHPRFVAGADPVLISAVRNGEELVLFEASGGPPQQVVTTADGVVVADRAGLAAVYLVGGELRYARLDARLRPERAVSAPLPYTRIEAFDAAAHGEHTAILARTARGSSLVVAHSSARGLDHVDETTIVYSVASPAVLWLDGQVIYAGITGAGTPGAQLFKSHLPVPGEGPPVVATDVIVVAVVTEVGILEVGDAPGQIFYDKGWLRVMRTLRGDLRPGENVRFSHSRQRVPVRDAESLLERGGTYVMVLDDKRRAKRIWPADAAAVRAAEELVRSQR